MAAASVGDNKAQNRFELDVEGAVAFANYRLAPGAVIITHTETPRALRGRGIASELVQGALKLIRADRLKVVAGCGSWWITCASIRSLRILWSDTPGVPTIRRRPRESGDPYSVTLVMSSASQPRMGRCPRSHR
jgi:predicted GNAT family acetyltransferase